MNFIIGLTPIHRTLPKGTYMITAATYQKVLFFNSTERIQFLHDNLLKLASAYGWELQAWAVLANHYHFIAQSPLDPQFLHKFIAHLHATSADFLNVLDNKPNRRIWWQYWDSHITYQHSYLARLNYVHQNPVKHGIVDVATNYPWCSAHWFETTAPTSFYKTVRNFKFDSIHVIDDF